MGWRAAVSFEVAYITRDISSVVPALVPETTAGSCQTNRRPCEYRVMVLADFRSFPPFTLRLQIVINFLPYKCEHPRCARVPVTL